jgi:RHS repeat-associated protein
MGMPGRKYSSGNGYRYGFNGKEKDKETNTDAYDFGARIYDGRIGRWLNVDPLFKKFEKYSPYSFSINNPVVIIDYDGRDIIDFISHVRRSHEYAIASSVWTQSATFNATLARFANVNKNDDSRTLGYSASGDLSTVKINFKPVETKSGADGDKFGFQGKTQIVAKDKKGKEVDLIGYTGNWSDIDISSISVDVQFNSNTSFGQKLAVGNHELLVHAEKNGELIKKLQDGKITFDQFQGEIKKIEANYQHTEMTNGFNAKYNQANAELLQVIRTSPTIVGTGVEYLGSNDYRDTYGKLDNTGTMTATMNKQGFITLIQAFLFETGPAEKSYWYRNVSNNPPLLIFKTKEDMEKHFNNLTTPKKP